MRPEALPIIAAGRVSKSMLSRTPFAAAMVLLHARMQGGTLVDVYGWPRGRMEASSFRLHGTAGRGDKRYGKAQTRQEHWHPRKRQVP